MSGLNWVVTSALVYEHYTDTAGYTTHVFSLCAALGFRFAPRIRDVLDQRLLTSAARRRTMVRSTSS